MITKIGYTIKIILFIIHFYFVFLMLHNILDTKLYGVIFLIVYISFIIKGLDELLSKKDRFKNDLIYNIMQSGVYLYLIIVAFKTYMAKIYVTRVTIGYFKTNYIILSLLIIFIFIYSFLEFKSSNK